MAVTRSSNLGAWAVRYAQMGLHVMPIWPIVNGECSCPNEACTQIGKHPMWSKWVQTASNDPKIIEKTWKQNSNAGIGCVPKGMGVVDIDPKSGGMASLERLEEEGGSLETPVLVRTGESKGVRGQHRWFKTDETMPKRLDFAKGVDWISENGYVVMPPSPHHSGVCYEWWHENALPDAAPDLPDWLYEVLRRVPGRAISPNRKTKVSARAWKFKAEGVDMQQRWEALAVARNLWRSGYTEDTAVAFVWEGLQQCPQLNVISWCEEDAVEIVHSIFTSAPKTSIGAEGQEVPGWSHLDLTDEGNAKNLTEIYSSVLLHTADQGRWYMWNDKRWSPDIGEVGMMRLARSVVEGFEDEIFSLWEERKVVEEVDLKKALQWVRTSRQGGRLDTMIDKARTLPTVTTLSSELDQQHLILNCLNGMLDLRTGDLLPHDSRMRITKVVHVKYDPKAKSKQFAEFLKVATDGDKDFEEFLQRICGYALTGSTQAHKLFFLYGPPATGKTTLLEAMRSLLGPYATSIPAVVLTKRGSDRSQPEIATLPGIRFVAMSELESGDSFADSLTSHITGGEAVSAREMYGHPFVFVPQCKLFLAANHAPSVRSAGSGIWRRLILLPFDNVVPEDRRNHTLVDSLKTTERQAVLAWAVEGCQKWLESGDPMFETQVPRIVAEAKKEYKSLSNNYSFFFEEEVEITGDPRDTVYFKDIRACHVEWCERLKMSVLANQRLAGELKTMGAYPEHTAKGARYRELRLTNYKRLKV